MTKVYDEGTLKDETPGGEIRMKQIFSVFRSDDQLQPRADLPVDAPPEFGCLFAGTASWSSLTDAAATTVRKVMLAPKNYESAGWEDIGFDVVESKPVPYLKPDSPLGLKLLEELLAHRPGFTFDTPNGYTWAVRSPGPGKFTTFAVGMRKGLCALDPVYRRRMSRTKKSDRSLGLQLENEAAARARLHGCTNKRSLQKVDSAIRLLLYLRDQFIESKSTSLTLEVGTTLTSLGETLSVSDPLRRSRVDRLLSYLRNIRFSQVVLWRNGWLPECIQTWRAADSFSWFDEDVASLNVDLRTADALDAFINL